MPLFPEGVGRAHKFILTWHVKPHAATPFIGELGEALQPAVAGSVDFEVIEGAVPGKVTLTPTK